MKNGTKSNGASRRDVLRAGSALAAGSVLASGATAQRARSLGGSRTAANHVYVQVFLRGAMDGLTTVVPHGDPDYYAARPDLAVAPPGSPNGALDLDGFFGLAPAAAPLLTPYGNGHLAIVHASGSVDPTRSHFDAFAKMEFAESGLPAGTVTEGWITRLLATRAPLGVLRALVEEDIVPLSLAGADGTLPIADPEGFVFPGDPLSAQERSDAIGRAYASAPSPVGSAALATLASIDLLGGVDFTNYAPANGAVYPGTPMGTKLRNAAATIKAGIGVEVIAMDMPGWDLHANLGPLTGSMALQLDELTKALEAFYLDMLATIDDVTVVVQSEFGRRVAQNSSLGLDHGHGNAMLVLGGGILGGQVLGTWPGLGAAQLDDGDLAITTDYRDVLAELLGARMGVSPTELATIFPMHTFSPVGIAV